MHIMNFVYHTSFIKFLYWIYSECVDYVDCSIALMHHVSWKGEWKLDQVDDLQSSTLDALKPRIHVTFAESLYSETTQRLVKWHICNFFFATGESTFETWKQTVLFASAQKSINLPQERLLRNCILNYEQDHYFGSIFRNTPSTNINHELKMIKKALN